MVACDLWYEYEVYTFIPIGPRKRIVMIVLLGHGSSVIAEMW